MYVSKPHIGTFRLTGVVARMREEIIALGGEVRFESKVTDVLIEDGQIEGVMLASGETIRSRHVVMALGHSARDTFRMLHARGVYIEAEAICAGFSHRASAIADRPGSPRQIRRSCGTGCGRLQARASREEWSRGLQLLHVPGRHRRGRDLRAAPRGDERHEPVLPQRTQCQRRHRRRHQSRNRISREAHSPEWNCRSDWNRCAYELGGSDYCAPGQLVGDFVRGVPSTAFGEVEPSYKPGVRLGDLSPSLPGYAIEAIREALPAFGKQIRGFDRDDAVLTGCRNTHVFARAHHPRSRHTAEPQRARPVPLRRRRWLCRRHFVGGCRRDQSGRSSGAIHAEREQPVSQ